MLDLFRGMMKEEWRVHTGLFGGALFILFPVIIILIVFFMALFAPVLRDLLTEPIIVLMIHLIVAFLGLNVGAFGLHGNEFMNRRFGHASLLAYSSKNLPLSEKKIFINFMLKDIVYYFFLFIVPAVLGIALSMEVMHLPEFSILSLLLSLSLSFLLGLALVFFLSALYSYSVRLLLGFLGLCAIASLALSSRLSYGLLYLFPPFVYFDSGSMSYLLYSVGIILVLSIISMFFIRFEHPRMKRFYKDSLARITGLFRFSSDRLYLAKDSIDLLRSRGGIGRIVFSLIFPMLLIWAFISFFVRFLPIIDFLVVFSIFLGVYTPSIYNWLCEYDSYNSYAFLPVLPSRIIMSKMKLTVVLSVISFVIFIIAAIGSPLSTVIPALIAFVSFFIYGLAVTINLTGLYPNI